MISQVIKFAIARALDEATVTKIKHEKFEMSTTFYLGPVGPSGEETPPATLKEDSTMEEITAYVTQSARKATPIGKATTQGEVLGTADTAEFDSAVMKSALKSFMGEIQPKVKELVGKADFSCDEAKKATWKKALDNAVEARLESALGARLEIALTPALEQVSDV